VLLLRSSSIVFSVQVYQYIYVGGGGGGMVDYYSSSVVCERKSSECCFCLSMEVAPQLHAWLCLCVGGRCFSKISTRLELYTELSCS
jgi:hypothetical protein